MPVTTRDRLGTLGVNASVLANMIEELIDNSHLWYVIARMSDNEIEALESRVIAMRDEIMRHRGVFNADEYVQDQIDSKHTRSANHS